MADKQLKPAFKAELESLMDRLFPEGPHITPNAFSALLEELKLLDMQAKTEDERRALVDMHHTFAHVGMAVHAQRGM